MKLLLYDTIINKSTSQDLLIMDNKQKVTPLDDYQSFIYITNREGANFKVPKQFAMRSEAIKSHEARWKTKRRELVENFKDAEFPPQMGEMEPIYINRSTFDVNNFIDYLSNYKYNDTETLVEMLDEFLVDQKETRKIMEQYCETSVKLFKIAGDEKYNGYVFHYQLPKSFNRYQIKVFVNILEETHKIDHFTIEDKQTYYLVDIFMNINQLVANKVREYRDKCYIDDAQHVMKDRKIPEKEREKVLDLYTIILHFHSIPLELLQKAILSLPEYQRCVYTDIRRRKDLNLFVVTIKFTP